ncbi:hypothetical protein MPH47_21405 [Psychrobacillus psychrodurans]|uniref:hypothetical protein n=1 Tax=Psychrobacillus psychrodurans TaxID=126157 RepID=UPI001F4E0A14|nr:hypothetical protein [Psychrobacillus psychrodurans]MCK1999745.1 hypothetical protein [Psychrobacillus psychrodurans]
MIYLGWFILFLFTVGCIALLVKAIVVASRGTINTPLFHNQDQFTKAEGIVQLITKYSVRNSHWFTHTFMRPRRKG